jgi:predicted DNA-binding transcriptional regulator AlpA
MTAKQKKTKGRRAKVKTLERSPAELKFDDPLLTPAETARRLGVAVDSLSIWRCTEAISLPYVKIGRLVKYFRSDVEAYLQSRRHVPKTAPERASA